MFNKIKKIFIIGSLFFLFFLFVASAQEQGKNPLTYKNEAMGIEITGPEGWYMHEPSHTLPGEEPEKLIGDLVLFTLHQWGSKSNSQDGSNIIISLGTDPVRDINGKILNGNTPLEYANYYIKVLKNMMDKIIEDPVLVKINNLDGVLFSYETEIDKAIRFSRYIFRKGDLFYSLEYASRPEYFDKHVKEFEGVVNTFVLK